MKQTKQNENTKELKNTAKLLKSIQEQSKSMVQVANKKLDSNKTIKLSKDEFDPKFLESQKIERISINNLTNTCSLSVSNDFALNVMGFIYSANMSEIKSNLKTFSEKIVFNRMIGSEIKNNPAPFLARL